MKFRKNSWTEQRRRGLAKKVDRLDRLETKNTITEPISITGLSISSLAGLVRLGIMHPYGGSNASSGLARPDDVAKQVGRAASIPFVVRGNLLKPILDLGAERGAGSAGGSAKAAEGTAKAAKSAAQEASSAWLTLNSPQADASESHGVSTPWQPAKGPGGGAALPPRGGSSAANTTNTATRAATRSNSLPASTPAASSAGSSAALLAAAASGSHGSNTSGITGGAESASRAASAGSAAHDSPAGGSAGGTSLAVTADPGTTSSPTSGGSTPLGSIADPVIGNRSGASQDTFTYFPMYVLDANDGVVLYPGVDQLATLRGSVILQAQVSNTTVSTYSWNTSGISSDATSISGGSTYQLSFRWTDDVTTAHVDPIVLSVTDSNNHSQTFTYDFELPFGSVPASGGGGNVTWPQSLSPDTVSSADPAWASDNVSVDSNSGSLDTSIPLPSYNPSIPALGLTYDSLSANPMPIIVAENTLSASGPVPSQVSATLTFNGTVGTTYYYSTSTLNPGDVQQIALQATTASSLATGRYAYSVQIVDHGTALTTVTLSGTTTLLNESSSAFGDGWSLDGLEQIIPETGGVILSLGGGSSLWFVGSFGSGGGTYTDPPGEFSTLVKSGGSYTDTLTDGTQVAFNSGGSEVATIDTNSQHITYTYSGSQLTSVTDNYGKITTFSYSGSYLSTIKDPAGRLTTFTFSGASLEAVEQADSSVTSFTYDGSGRMTQLKDPLGNVVSIAYDSAERTGTITTPNLGTEEFSAYQEQGWTNSGTSGESGHDNR